MDAAVEVDEGTPKSLSKTPPRYEAYCSKIVRLYVLLMVERSCQGREAESRGLKNTRAKRILNTGSRGQKEVGFWLKTNTVSTRF